MTDSDFDALMVYMRISLNRSSGEPLYRQIAEYLEKAIKNGSYPYNSRLPSVRELSRINGISRITAEKAYEYLESANMVQIRPGSGVFTLLPLHTSISQNRDTSKSYRPFDPVVSDNLTDFSYGGGDSRLFPMNDFKNCLQKAVNMAEEDLFSYGDIRGYTPLRESVSQILSAQGLMIRADNILVTNGSQQALSLICRRFLKPGSRIITESLIYGEALNLFRTEGYEIIPVPVDENGMRTDLLKTILDSKSADMIYTIPNFQNPTGATLSINRREELIGLSNIHNIPIIEDDYLGDLSFQSSNPPPLKAMAPESRIHYIGTFSKMLIPGLRFGYLASNTEEYRILVEYKRHGDLTSPYIIQKAIQSFISLGRYQNHIERSRKIYRKRRDSLIGILRSELDDLFDFFVPHGGIFLWVKCPPSLKEGELFEKALKGGIKLAPGAMFRTDPDPANYGFRLNFACLTEEEISCGIRNLAGILPN